MKNKTIVKEKSALIAYYFSDLQPEIAFANLDPICCRILTIQILFKKENKNENI